MVMIIASFAMQVSDNAFLFFIPSIPLDMVSPRTSSDSKSFSYVRATTCIACILRMRLYVAVSEWDL